MKTIAAPLTPEQLEALRRLDACTLANAIETFHAYPVDWQKARRRDADWGDRDGRAPPDREIVSEPDRHDSGAGEFGLSSFRRQYLGLTRLYSHLRNGPSCRNWWTENQIRRFAPRKYSRGTVHSD